MNDGSPALSLVTSRLRLAPATRPMIGAELEAQDQLADVLGAVLPADWPPEHHDVDTLRFWLDALSQVGAAGWWLHYVVLTDTVRPTLVGTVGTRGPLPMAWSRFGYSVVPSWQRRGLATEACRALIESAWERGAEVVVAHTLPHLEPSIGVLRKLGLTRSEPPEPDVLAFTLRRG